jgi:ParB-like chromosome segregation protein Spo0J
MEGNIMTTETAVMVMEMRSEMIRADTLTRFPEQQIRAATDANLIAEYAAAMLEGVTFPPIVVFEDSNGDRFLADGHHRVDAAALAALQDKSRSGEVLAEIRRGGIDDAIRYALQANRAHGKRLSSEDWKRSYGILVSRGMIRSARAEDVVDEVRALLGCGRSLAFEFTKELRRTMVAKRNRVVLQRHEEGKTQQQIADELGIGRKTVDDVLSEFGGKSARGFSAKRKAPPKTPAEIAHEEAKNAKTEVEIVEIATAEPEETRPTSTRIDVSCYLPKLRTLLLDAKAIEASGAVGDIEEVDTPDDPAAIKALTLIVETMGKALEPLGKGKITGLRNRYSAKAAAGAREAIAITVEFLEGLADYIEEGESK